MSELFAAWLAGFWEGEGCFSISKSPKAKYSTISFSLSQSKDRGLKILQQVQKYLRARGVQCGIGVQHMEPNPCYHLRVQSAEGAKRLYKIISPYMQFRLDEFALAIEEVYERGPAGREWTDSEIAYLRENYGHFPVDVMALWLNRSPTVVSRKAVALGITAAKSWSKEDDDWLADHLNIPIKDACQHFSDKGECAVRCRRLKLAKDRGLKLPGRWPKGEK